MRRNRKLISHGAVLALALVVAGCGKSSGSKANEPPPQPADTSTPLPLPTETASAAPSASAAPGTVNCQYIPDTRAAPARKVEFPSAAAENTKPYYVTMVTNHGTIKLELNAAAAPCAVNSFVSLVKQGYYDNTPCHRLVDAASQGLNYGVLQCGDPSGSGRGGPGYSFADENLTGAKYLKGLIAMANSGRNTNGSQFFMMFKDSDFAPNYTPFGHITSGVDVLTEIAKGGSEPPSDGAPKTKTTIEKVTVSTKP